MKHNASFIALSILIGLFSVTSGLLPVQAATITVDETTCTLIDAISAANADAATGGCPAGSGADTIVLAANVTLTVVDNTSSGNNGLPSITSNIRIEGEAFTIARSSVAGTPSFRIFYLASSGTLMLNDVTVSNGSAEGNFPANRGGGIFNNGTVRVRNSSISYNSASSAGGGILNQGTVTLNNSRISRNEALNYLGGGILNFGRLTLNNSIVSGNSATSNVGGGIYNSGGLTTLNNSTISGNLAGDDGGGLANRLGTLTLSNSTISGNSASDLGGGIFDDSGTWTLSNSIVSGNSAINGVDECQIHSGTFNSNANNLFGTNNDSGGCTAGASDIIPSPGIHIADILAALADNGGPTQTHALIFGSPAIDGSGTGATVADQRGAAAVGSRDIGAYEFGVTPTYPEVQFSTSGATYNENAGIVGIELTLSGASDFAGVAEFSVLDTLAGSATSGADYDAFPMETISVDCSVVDCGAGTTVTVSVTISSDALSENDETVLLEIISTNGFATVGGMSTFTLTIEDPLPAFSSAPAAGSTLAISGLFGGAAMTTLDVSNTGEAGSLLDVSLDTITAGYTVVGGLPITGLTPADGSTTLTVDCIPGTTAASGTLALTTSDPAQTGANYALTCSTYQFTIGGIVSGLQGDQVVLQNNGSDDQVVTADGGFTFAAQDDGTSYNVTVAIEPSNPSQTCTVTNGTGTLTGSDVTDVEVSCSTDQFTVGGTVAGLEGDQVVLYNNSGDEQVVTADGGFTFAAQDDGTGYDITVATQPSNPSQTCTVANGTGTLSGANVTDVEITCTTDPFTVGGTVIGLEGDQVVLQNNGADDQVVTANGGFAFPSQDDGSVYEVTVLTQPVGPIQTCLVSNGSGSLAGADVTDVQVQCSNEPPEISLSFDDLDFGVLLTGQQSSQVVTLTNTGTGELQIDQISNPALPFALNGGSCLALPLTLVPSESCDIEVSFAPDAAVSGEILTGIEIVSNADSSPNTISLRGQAVLPLPVPMLGPFGLIALVLLLAGLARRRLSAAANRRTARRPACSLG